MGCRRAETKKLQFSPLCSMNFFETSTNRILTPFIPSPFLQRILTPFTIPSDHSPFLQRSNRRILISTQFRIPIRRSLRAQPLNLTTPPRQRYFCHPTRVEWLQILVFETLPYSSRVVDRIPLPWWSRT